MSGAFVHTSVLLPETIDSLQPRAGGHYVDATVGGGGHAEKILELSSPTGTLLGIDADPAALQAAQSRLAPFGERATLRQAYFDELGPIAVAVGLRRVDGILFDLGVSSPQLDTPARGFSFQHDAPLDMRFGPGAGQTAADLVNGLPSEELERVFREYGEERYARRVARRIDTERKRAPIETTGRLAEVVTAAKPPSRGERIHPATRVFQALRIAVNGELERLERALPQAVDLLTEGGRVAVITFHSLEDRIVKRFLREKARGCVCPPELPVCVCGRTPSLRILTPRPITASPDEVRANPRSRSAKLRAAEKIESSTPDITTRIGGAA